MTSSCLSNYVQLYIISTGKGYAPKSEWQGMNDETKTFANIKEAQAYLKERYGKAKRAPMYVDVNGKSKQIGWVIGFRNADWSHHPVDKWIQRDWVEVRCVGLMAVGKNSL